MKQLFVIMCCMLFSNLAFAQDQTGNQTEFVTQILEPLGGKILRPKNWYYFEAHSEPVYSWLLSLEDASKEQDITSVKIQIFTQIKKNTGKTSKQFAMDSFNLRKKEATKIISTCDEENMGLFTRICLETEEGPYHVKYSMFWLSSEDSDMLIVQSAGTKKELWETYAPTFDAMSSFEPIDMSRFDE
ncbi:MAG: hypothetical protein DHS20C02_04480 [Micavibrio sp.]|nr:MAG: hypothetical protein DHS20C02_04480 [Micavibrio sp.]